MDIIENENPIIKIEETKQIQNEEFKQTKSFKNEEELSSNLDLLWENLSMHLEEINNNPLDAAIVISDLIYEITEILIENSNNEQYRQTVCLFCKRNNPFYKVYTWTGKHRECLKVLAKKQLNYFNRLVSSANVELLCYAEVHVPIFLLLLSMKPTDKRKVPPDIQVLYVQILFHICEQVLNKNFLDILCKDVYVNEHFVIPKCTFFELLLNYTHHGLPAGKYAQDGILLCIQNAKDHAEFENYITASSLCVIIAGGLSAHYSSLPTTFEIMAEDWHMITTQDLSNMKELEDFLRALRFCCAVVKISNDTMQKKLVELIHNGFLLSVLVPALNQSLVEAQITVMAYLDLFLRCITSERIMGVFLKVLMTEAYDNKPLIDLLIYHINSDCVQLSTVALQLFKTLLELNCEDVMFCLIFKYLLPCHHLLPNQKRTIKEVDFYCKSATMFLYLTPSCCIEALRNPDTQTDESPELRRSERSESSISSDHSSPVGSSRKASLNSSTGSTKSQTSLPTELTPQQTLDFMAYLSDARERITACKKACQCWSAVYDGMDVVTENPRFNSNAYSVGRFGSINEPGGVISFVRSPSIVSTKSTDSDVVESVVPDLKLPLCPTTDCLGPFLNALLIKVEGMIENNLYTNLLLTSVITRLACFPQPLLRSFLMNSNLVIQPGVRSLIQTLTRVSFITDAFLLKLDDHKILLRKARQNLLNREIARSKRFSQEVCDINSNETEESVSININTSAGSGRFQKKEVVPIEKNGRIMGADDIVSLLPNMNMTHNSINTSPSTEEAGKMTNTFVPHSHGKLHPAIPKSSSRSPKWRKNAPSKKDVSDIRKSNPSAIKNAIYCAIVLEELMKELAAISLEQTLL